MIMLDFVLMTSRCDSGTFKAGYSVQFTFQFSVLLLHVVFRMCINFNSLKLQYTLCGLLTSAHCVCEDTPNWRRWHLYLAAVEGYLRIFLYLHVSSCCTKP